MQLSIIIPVYNVAAYIEKCILSLQEQDIPKERYEIITINDGSTDDSKEILLNLANRFSNIVFIDQVNKGVSLARNAGMDLATGKYLLFIDPDDYVIPNSFSKILQEAETNQAQIAFLGFEFLNADGSLKKHIFYKNIPQKIYMGIDAYHNSRNKDTVDPDRCWAILFDRTFINNATIRFIANVPYLEDGEFISRVLCLAERCIFQNTPFYKRTTREGSATNSKLFFSSKSVDGFVLAAANLKEFSQKQQLSDGQRNFLNQPIAKFTLLAIQSSIHPSAWRKFFEVKQNLHKYQLDKLSVVNLRQPYAAYAKLYNVSPFVFIIFLWWKKLGLSIKFRLNKLGKK